MIMEKKIKLVFMRGISERLMRIKGEGYTALSQFHINNRLYYWFCIFYDDRIEIYVHAEFHEIHQPRLLWSLNQKQRQSKFHLACSWMKIKQHQLQITSIKLHICKNQRIDKLLFDKQKNINQIAIKSPKTTN